MKTSKRLLSIVLMLAMLVSMFTVMAFAGDKVKVTFDIGKGGTASIGNKTLISREYSFTLAEINSAYVVVSPKSGYVADVMIGDTKLDQAQANYGFSLSSDMDGKTIKITFSEKDAGGEPEPTPDPEPSANVNLRIGMWASDVQNAEILRDGKALDITTAVSFTEEELKEGVKLTANADDKTYSVKWTLNEGTPVEGKTFTLPTDLKDGSKLLVEFTADTKPEPETKHTLTVSSKDDSMGLIQYGENEKKSIDFSLEKKEKVTVKAVAKKGYEFVEWRADGIELTRSQKQDATLKITMPDNDVKVTAVFQKKTVSGDYKLTLDVSRHGDVYENSTRGDDAKSYYWLDDDDELTFKAVADKGYEVRWRIGKGRWNYTSKITVNARDMGWDNATLDIDFVSSSSTPSSKNYTLSIDITGGKHGTLSYKNSTVSDGKTYSLEKNDTMTFKAEPDKGYVAAWKFGTETYVGSSYTVKMGSKDATLYVSFVDKNDYRWGNLPFHDVTNRDWYYDDVLYAYINGLMDGISMTSFGADQNTTRGQVVTILWRLTGEPRAARNNQFTDVSSNAYYNTAISWAAENGIVKGYDSKTFRPNANVTREQLAAILYRYAEYMNLSTKGASNLTKFDDYYTIGTWARDSLAWANYHGLINGVDSYHIDPKGNTTRAQLAAILHRFAVEFG
ncbi:hypothetical protein [Oscillospiraceae bacterium]|nr:hypothetical protein [Oscillospiraceae bacterium]